MKNPLRINLICDELNKLWHKNPEARFHQLIQRFMNKPGERFKDYYNVEDEETMRRMLDYGDTDDGKIQRLKTFIDMFEITLKQLENKKQNETYDSCDRWHETATKYQLREWYKELVELENAK